MTKPKLRLGFREPEIDTNRPFVEGQIQVEGFELEVSNFKGPESVDAWDAAFGGLMRTKGAGQHPYISIPAFPNRKFRIAYIFVNGSAGIQTPRDLEGKRVGILAWENTAGIWARGALQNHFGVNLSRIHWFEPGFKGKAPENVVIEALPLSAQSKDVALDEYLLTGEIDAVIGPNVLRSISCRDPRVRRLFPDYKAVEQDYFRATGIFPISHVVTLNKGFVASHPDAPVALLKAFRLARDIAIDRIYGSDPEILTVSWASALMDEQRALMGENYWAYNILDNKRTLQAMMLFARQQGITPQELDFESFFDTRAAAVGGA